jgi:hypothetical protein
MTRKLAPGLGAYAILSIEPPFDDGWHRRWLTMRGCPDPLPPFLPIGTKTKGGAIANTALQLVTKDIVPGMFDEEPQQYIGLFCINGKAMMGHGMVHAIEVVWGDNAEQADENLGNEETGGKVTSSKSWEANFLGVWTLPSATEKTALMLVLEFEVACERFDRTLPGFMKYGEWIPVGEGRRSSMATARARRSLMVAEARRLGITDGPLVRAERDVLGMSFERQQLELEWLQDWARTNEGTEGAP